VFKAPRGTHDILPKEQRYWHHVESVATSLSRKYGYHRLDTPALEDAGLFLRTVGEGTDIVEKETYTFTDRGGEIITLRAEGTAPICRAYLEHGMHNLPQPVRLYYFCPVFRYERPQAGRYRLHHQFGIEAIGDADPSVDVEVIELAWNLLKSFGLKDLSLLVNSIGDSECRPNYLQELQAYYHNHLSQLCDDCRSRYSHNPLRLLDCKRTTCRPYIEDAPRSYDYLCTPCLDHWNSLTEHLKALGIPYRPSHTLVRGLDYYTRTVFEIQPADQGAQSTILGGGRYDGLIQELGGKPTPGIGFGTGIERIVLNLKQQDFAFPDTQEVATFLASVGDPARHEAILLASRLRSQGITVILAPAGKSLKSQMRHASALGSSHAIILGQDEIDKHMVTIRNMHIGTQDQVSLSDLSGFLQKTANSGDTVTP
jgi:histidyl-tRNA synthetase